MVIKNIATINYGFEARIHFEGYNKENDTNPTTKKPGIRSHDWFTAFVLRILGLGHLVTELKTESGVIYLNKNSFDKWREVQVKDLNFSYTQPKLPTAEEIISRHNLNLENAGMIDTLPSDSMKIILMQSGLSIYDQVLFREVKKSWHSIISTELAQKDILFTPELKFKDPHVRVFGERAWEKYYGYEIEGEIPQPPENIMEIIKTIRKNLEGIEESPSLSLILMPKGLTFSKLTNIVQNPVTNNSQYSQQGISNYNSGLKESTIFKSYWTLIIHDFKKTKTAANPVKKSLFKALGVEYHLPCILEAAACSFLNLVSNDKEILKKKLAVCLEFNLPSLSPPLVYSMGSFGHWGEEGLTLHLSLYGGTPNYYTYTTLACKRFPNGT